MNEEKFKKGIEDLRKIGLTSAEKFRVKSNLDFYIETSTPTQVVKSSWYSGYSFAHTKLYSGAFALVLVVILGADTYSMAEKALPGDTLYPVKVGVLEPLRYTTALSNEAKANLEVANLDTRLREAEMLQVQGKLTDIVSTDLQNRINLNTEKFNKIVQDLNNQNKLQDDSDVEIDFEAKINAHTRILDNIAQSDQDENIKKLKRAIVKRSSDEGGAMAATMVSAKVMMFSSEPTTPQPTTTEITSTTTDKVFIQRKKDTEKIIKSARENIEKSKRSLRANKRILDDAEGLINDAQKSLDDADKHSRSGDSEEAKQSLINSRIRAKEANTSIEVSQDLSREED